jgi:hypothetical protein
VARSPRTLPWHEVEAEIPGLAASIQERLEAHRHLVMATLRADGSPRLCGTEATFWDGQLWIGAMAGSRRFADLRRDPRIALHSGSDDPPHWTGDARVAGLAVIVEDEAVKRAFLEAIGHEVPGPFELARLLVGEVALVALTPAGDALAVTSWRPGELVRRTDRR